MEKMPRVTMVRFLNDKNLFDVVILTDGNPLDVHRNLTASEVELVEKAVKAALDKYEQMISKGADDVSNSACIVSER